MSIRSMRIGDTIISKNGDYFEVTEIGWDRVETKNERNRVRVFKSDTLECVDYNDGFWQEMEN